MGKHTVPLKQLTKGVSSVKLIFMHKLAAKYSDMLQTQRF
jgi:hypothetical protein